MQSTNTKHYTDKTNKLEKDIAELSDLTNVKKIVDKNKLIFGQITSLEQELDNMKTTMEQSIESIKIDESNVDAYISRLKQLKDKSVDINLDESIANYQEAAKIVRGLKAYYGQLKIEVTQLK